MQRFSPRLEVAGYAPAPAPERVTNTFTAIGQDWMNDISFPSAQLDPAAQVMARNTGDLCKHCFLPPSAHLQSEAAAAGYERLGPQIPGVHPDTDTALNSADYADPRRGEFGVGRSAR